MSQEQVARSLAFMQALNLLGAIATPRGLVDLREQMGEDRLRQNIREAATTCRDLLTEGRLQGKNPEVQARILDALKVFEVLARADVGDDQLRSAAHEVALSFMLSGSSANKANREGKPDWRPKVERIDNPIAEDVWTYLDEQGREVFAKVLVGRPEPIPGDKKGTWYCPVAIEHREPAIRCCFGVGPVDSLMNAMDHVRKFFWEVRPAPMSAPGASS